MVVDVVGLEDRVDGKSVQGELDAAGGVRPWVVDLDAPPLFRVRHEAVVVVLASCRSGDDVSGHSRPLPTTPSN